MSEEKIRVISKGKNTAQVVIRNAEGGSVTRHLRRNGTSYTDNYGNSYKINTNDAE